MKFVRISTYVCLAFVLAACTAQSPVPSSTATSIVSPIPAQYYFAPHTADEAQEMLAQAEKEVLVSFDHLEMPLGTYSYNYRAVFYAAWNAILYFPDDPRAETWRWKLAYYAAMGGESDLAAGIYTKKITQALNEEKIPVEDLPAWFHSGELEDRYETPHFELKTQAVNIPARKYTYLMRLGVLKGIDIPGSMCLLITEDKGKSTTYLVYDGFAQDGFFPTLRNPSYCSLEDATGDGLAEIIAESWSGGHVGTTSFQVFDITNLPPKPLSFNSSRDEKITVWNGSAGKLIHAGEKIQIPISKKLGQCDMHLTRDFEWNGDRFETVTISFDRNSSRL